MRETGFLGHVRGVTGDAKVEEETVESGDVVRGEGEDGGGEEGERGGGEGEEVVGVLEVEGVLVEEEGVF